jgi:hypothetical protein
MKGDSARSPEGDVSSRMAKSKERTYSRGRDGRGC